MREHFPPVIKADLCEKFHQNGKTWPDFVRNQEHFESHCPVPRVSRVTHLMRGRFTVLKQKLKFLQNLDNLF